MTNCMHIMHPPNIYKFYEGVMIIFVSGKNQPLLLAKGVHWCLMFMCTLHLWPGTWDTSQRKFITFHQLAQILIYLDWLDFLYLYVLCIQTYWFFFIILEIQFLLPKMTKLGTSFTRRHVINEANYINLWLWLIDRWNMIFVICRVPSCFKLQHYGQTDFIHCIDDRPIIVYCRDCVKLLQYPCIFYSIL